jgi:hypothetical protein
MPAPLDKDEVRRVSRLEDVIPALLGVSLNGGSGSREPKIRCPFHDDQTPSFRVNLQKQLWRCDPCDDGGDVFDLVQRAQQVDFPQALRWLADRAGLAAPGPPDRPRWVHVCDFVYTDEQGATLYRKRRYEDARGSVDGKKREKDFRLERWDAVSQTWRSGLDGTRRVPYRLHNLRDKPAIVCVEGEGKADRLWRLGIPATCTDVSGKWTAEHAQLLRAVGVQRAAVIPDKDEKGMQVRDQAAGILRAGALEVRVLDPLPGVSAMGDVIDWLDAGHTRDELLQLLQTAPVYIGTPNAASGTDVSRGLALTTLGDLLNEPDEVVHWVVEGRIPSGGLSMIAGKPKGGKSTLARDLAFRVSRGEPWVGFTTTAGPVWYLALEEKRAELRRHFSAMGATGYEPLRLLIAQAPEDAIAQLQAQSLRERPVLIIVDTLQRLIRCKDLNDYAEVTNKMEPIIRIARDSGAALVLVHHAGKGARGGIDSVLGSTALAASVDNVFVLSRSDQVRTLLSFQRIGDDLEETIITLDKQTQHVSLGMTRDDAEQAEIERAMVAVLRQRPGLTEKELGEDVEGKTTLKRKALRELHSTGVVIRAGDGARGDPYRYWLKDAGDDPEGSSVPPASALAEEGYL